jgi:uncharacterized SAM-binding protein YcdF (DUF218 family)
MTLAGPRPPRYAEAMDYALVKILALLISPGSLLLATLALAVVLLWRRRAWRWGRGLVTLLTLLLAMLLLSPLQPWLAERLEDRFPAAPALPARIDGIIVLGGMIREDVSRSRGRPSLNDAADRLLEGAALARTHPEAKLLFTGGSADPWHPESREADVAATLLRQLGVAPERLILEDRSRNTRENALFSQQLAQPQPGQAWILVTSAAHMPRAVGVFRRIGWPVIPWPVNYLTTADSFVPADWVNEDMALLRLYRLSRILHEWGGLLYYRLRGWSDSLLPAPI